jgi:AraC-like DNA-binding protein
MENHGITPEILSRINDVIHNQYTGPGGEIYLEARFIDIIILSLTYRKKETYRGLDENDIKKIKEAHSWITRNIQAHHTINMITDELHISKQKLQKGFKVLFGTTVHQLIVDERLKKAVVLLRDTTKGIGEIAKTVGYPNRKGFSKLFRQKFGYPPAELRKKEA